MVAIGAVSTDWAMAAEDDSFNLTLLGRIGHWSKCLEISGRRLGASNQSQRPVGSLSRLEELGGV